ncbi:MAG TPA: LuxR C-terminal-related transcriptional regulator [Jatrophihabitantaceae bacterium]
MTTAEQGRAAFEAAAWTDAYERFTRADVESELDPEDIERLATVAFLVGKEAESSDLWARAHQRYLRLGDIERAAGCITWLAFGLLNRGELAQAGGWLARAATLLDDAGLDCVPRGHLLMLTGMQSLFQGDVDAALANILQAADVAARFGDADLSTLSKLAQGQILLMQDKPAQSVAMFDQVMVAVTAGEVSPTVAGLAYCGTISACQAMFDVRRAREWSAALSRWCDEQPDLVPYSGWCLVHRGEIMQLHGSWADAADAAQRAYQRSLLSTDQAAGGGAHYVLGEVHRLRGDFVLAEQAYREASRLGREPQPGLALLRLAQGQVDAAASTIRRVVDEAATDGAAKVRVLAAHAEIMIAAGDIPGARASVEGLAELAELFGAPVLQATAAQCSGALLLSAGDARAALAQLRRAWTGWQQVEVPYEAARTRALIGQACRALGDEDAAQMEFDAARWAFMQLGATPDLVRVETLVRPARVVPDNCGLTAREIEVLRLVASGKTNAAVAADLFLSEKTVARHMSNIFAKLDISSRAAATAFAYEHDLV